jgi:hypothetical protein
MGSPNKSQRSPYYITTDDRLDSLESDVIRDDGARASTERRSEAWRGRETREEEKWREEEGRRGRKKRKKGREEGEAVMWWREKPNDKHAVLKQKQH